MILARVLKSYRVPDPESPQLSRLEHFLDTGGASLDHFNLVRLQKGLNLLGVRSSTRRKVFHLPHERFEPARRSDVEVARRRICNVLKSVMFLNLLGMPRGRNTNAPLVARTV